MKSSDHRCRPLVEVCVGSLTDAIAAAAAGADRLELCSATEIGGLTPSMALIERVIQSVAVPVVVMIRPRAGGFCYSREEFAVAMRDAELAIERGAAGIVFGFLSANGRIDVSDCREFCQLAGDRHTICHRAFDFVPDPMEAVDKLVDLGVTRLLTSGQKSTAIAGADLIRAIRDRTLGSLEVMAGGGINADNVEQVLQQTQCSQIHIGASRPVNDGSLNSNREVNLFTADMSILEGGCFRAVESSLAGKLADRVSQWEHS